MEKGSFVSSSPLYGIALISSDSVNGQKLIFRYPENFCGQQVMSLFFSKRDTTGWKRFAQLFNPFSKSKDITVSMGDSLSMISRCIINETSEKSADSSAYVIVVLVNNQIVNADFHFDSFEDFATKLSMCLLKEEVRSSYLTNEKSLLLSIFKEYKHSVRSGSISEQFFMNLQLERSQLARELAQIYHEVNYFHHTSIRLHSVLPFHYTLPTRRKPFTCVEYYTSEMPVSEKNIELYYAVLLLYPPSFYIQAEKCDTNSFLTRFVSIASPFLPLEEMSILLDVPIERVFAQALSLQAANTATILMCFTKHTHLIMAPDLDFARIYTKSQQFETQFQELGPLSNLLALFSICPSLGDVFSQFHIPYTPQSSVVYNAIIWLLKERLVLPVAIHCQYIPSYIPLMQSDESEIKEGEGHHRTHSHPLKHALSSPHTISSTPDLESIASESAVSTKMKKSPYFPLSFLSLDSINDPPESYGSYSRFSPEHVDHSHMRKSKSGSYSSFPASKATNETKSAINSALLEKCIPLMKDHYCVDEICHILNTSHDDFYDMVRDNTKHFFIYYVVQNV